ncbi:MAG: tetratricopeptide repeat protein [Acetobacteraceae bacterium]|nr:tetratricopeptide repeat protein [Acetobacteraceae bacterium]
MDCWRINILGRFELCAPNGQEVALRARKSIALISLLGASPTQRLSRDRLALLLWEDMADGQARGNLRQLLAVTRGVAPFVEADPHIIGFAPGAAQSDIGEFEAALTEDTPASLEQAASLYRGDLLEGLSLRCRDFEEWLVAERERLRERAVQLFLRLMERAAASGIEPAIRWALRVLTVDPLHEPVHRALMQFYASQGRHAAALRQYEQLRDTLAQELGTRPEAETAALARRIREGRAGATKSTGPPLALDSDSRGDGPEMHTPPGPAVLPSIAVLPFNNLSGDPDQEYFSDGIAEDITTLLSRTRWLFVISRNSSFTYKGRALEVKQVARDLGVRYVLEGSVRRGGERVRVNAQLIDAETDHHVWARRYDRDLADVFAVQDEITNAVVEAIAPTIAQLEQRRALRKPPENLNAWEAYQRGLWYKTKRGRDNLEQSRALFQRATELDPLFAAAHAMLGMHYIDASLFGNAAEFQRALETAGKHANHALALDPDEIIALDVLSWIPICKGQYPAALELAERALAIDPNDIRALLQKGRTLLHAGRPQEARAPLYTALRLSPRDSLRVHVLTHLSVSSYVLGEYEDAARTAWRAVQDFPDWPNPYRWLAAALGQLGRVEQARQILDQAMQLSRSGFDFLIRSRPPWIPAEHHELMLEGLRKAGWQG